MTNQEQTYIIGYWYYHNDDYDHDTIEVKAKSEEEALEKAKDLLPRSARKDKLKIKLKESKKMKRSEAIAYIKEQVLSSINEKKKKEPEEEVETSSEEIEEPVTDTGSDTKAVQASLTKLQDAAKTLNDDKLNRQISNLITYVTRTHVSKGNEQ